MPLLYKGWFNAARMVFIMDPRDRSATTAAPDGHAAAQTPHPWQARGSTIRVRVSGSMNRALNGHASIQT